MTDKDKEILQQWEQHDPFKRASPDLVEAVEKIQRKAVLAGKYDFLENLEESLF